MAEVLVEPQFQIFTHPKTGAKVGRIYFPALFLAEFHASVTKWLQRREIIFDEKDLKQYGDGSFRLYFRTQSSLETEYFRLVKPLTGRKQENFVEHYFPNQNST
ncbi:MAG: hypothetical protein C6Y22_30060 [Hapalosiphonaceae cyanobacterium JJU2]|nr:MAG: hypothetical protein C6Y22_30060 [Hapalosiphonaceae cyanobacterium JJU2]